MCFGNQTQKTVNTNQSGTSNSTTQYIPNNDVKSAANQNLNFVQKIQDLGYTPYTGQRVADFSGTQQKGFDVADMANEQGTDWTNAYGNAPAQSVGYNTIASMMSPYMNQYVDKSLAPQLDLLQKMFEGQNKANDAAATSSGAFGDKRAAIQHDLTQEQQDQQRQSVIANAYDRAFNTAIGAGAQDVANKNTQQVEQGNFNETALGRGLTALNSQEGLAQFLQQIGAIQQQQDQAKLNVPYSDYLAAMQYPFLTSQLSNQAIATGAAALPPQAISQGSSTGTGTQVTSAPDNSGLQLAGSILGSIITKI